MNVTGIFSVSKASFYFILFFIFYFIFFILFFFFNSIGFKAVEPSFFLQSVKIVNDS